MLKPKGQTKMEHWPQISSLSLCLTQDECEVMTGGFKVPFVLS